MVDKWLKWENGKEWEKIQCPMLGNEYVTTYYLEDSPRYYSYTAPFICDGDICIYRYDHDVGGWDEDQIVLLYDGEYTEKIKISI